VSNLGLGDDFDGDVLALVLALLGLGGARVAEVAAADLLAEVVLSEEVLGEAEALVQAELRLAALGNGHLVGLDRAVPPREESADVLGRRRRRERALEPAARRGGRDARVCRRALVAGRRERARQVERELGLFRRAWLRRGRRRRRRGRPVPAVARAGGYVGILLSLGLRDLRRLAMAEPHGPDQELEEGSSSTTPNGPIEAKFPSSKKPGSGGSQRHLEFSWSCPRNRPEPVARDPPTASKFFPWTCRGATRAAPIPEKQGTALRRRSRPKTWNPKKRETRPKSFPCSGHAQGASAAKCHRNRIWGRMDQALYRAQRKNLFLGSRSDQTIGKAGGFERKARIRAEWGRH
jgi:hypothetical protein